MFLVSRPRFIQLAYSILRNKEDAEDAVQNAMLSAYLHLQNFEGRSTLTTWFTRIVFNAALMLRRKRKPATVELFPDCGESDETCWIESIPATQPDPEMACAEAETFRAINELLGGMSPVLRQAFTMAYYEELSAKEASALLGVIPGTFKARRYRARQSHPTNATFPRGPRPVCNTRVVFFRKQVVHALGRTSRGNSDLRSCVRMTNRSNLVHLSGEIPVKIRSQNGL